MKHLIGLACLLMLSFPGSSIAAPAPTDAGNSSPTGGTRVKSDGIRLPLVGKEASFHSQINSLHPRTIAAALAPGERISLAARNSLGKQMWKGYGLANGYLGCAAALSNVLNLAGYKQAHSAAVTAVRNQLLAKKDGVRKLIIRDGPKEELLDSKLLSLAKPGDIVLAFAKPPGTSWNGGGDAHCGILATPTDIYTNDWNDGIWKKVNIHQMFDYYPYLRILRMER